MSKPPVRPIRRVVSPPILRPAVKPASPPVKGVEKEKCTDEVSEEKRSVASVRPVMRPLSRPAVRPVTQPPRPVVVAKKAEEKNNEVAEGSNKVPDAKPEPHAKTQAPQTNPTVRRVGMPPRVASPPRTVSPAPAVSPRPAASSSAPASNPAKGRRSSSLVPGNGSVSEPKKPQGRRRSGLAAAAGEIRTAEEQQQYRDDGLSEMDRRGYALADQRMAQLPVEDCPFTPDPDGYAPPLDWSAIGGPPPGIVARDICDDVANHVMESVQKIKRNYPEPTLPKAPPPPPGSQYDAFFEWVLSALSPTDQEVAFHADTAEERFAIDMFLGLRPDIYAMYNRSAKISRNTPNAAP